LNGSVRRLNTLALRSLRVNIYSVPKPASQVNATRARALVLAKIAARMRQESQQQGEVARDSPTALIALDTGRCGRQCDPERPLIFAAGE
jgi:hypothetical protein